MAAELPETDVQELLAAAPQEPADAAAYLALIGQSAQSRALDPDGSLLALAYRAAPTDVRERLRTVMAADGDTDVIRVVVTGDQRDRIAEMSYAELDYLGHQLAEHRLWDELRRLARDLPLAKAVAAAGLLPERERTSGGADDAVGLLDTLAQRSGGQLRAMVERLPQDRLITRRTRGARAQASFSPCASELALKYSIWKWGKYSEFAMETLSISTGAATPRFIGKSGEVAFGNESILHLGDEIIVRMRDTARLCRIIRVLPDQHILCSSSELSDMRRSSRGAVLLHPAGLAFVDPGADQLRYEKFPRFSENQGGSRISAWLDSSSTLTTLPESRLIAFINRSEWHVVSESGMEIIQTAQVSDTHADKVAFSPALSLLSPHSLALHRFVTHPGKGEAEQHSEIWEFTPKGTPRRTAEHEGAVLDRWPPEKWQGLALDNSFAARILTENGRNGYVRHDLPWLQRQVSPHGYGRREFLALSPWGDMLATNTVLEWDKLNVCEVHSPHLPSARELLEQPLLHSGPQDVLRVRELRTKVGDPAVRDALDLLATCLEERFGQDITLGSGPRTAGGTTDIALGENGEG
ncbi:hypothetical protein [Streptomyces lanatus]|uniref:Uncharacterized protein n=1 Tax=Streptomyces lanatus TaxID=66900 RepID=A0ABV1XLD6_9ACTN|nr:hypothetical protein [Streptomyces lanatus]